MIYFEESVKMILPSVAAQSAIKTNSGRDGIEDVNAIMDSTVHVGGPRMGMVFRKKIIRNSCRKMFITMVIGNKLDIKGFRESRMLECMKKGRLIVKETLVSLQRRFLCPN